MAEEGWGYARNQSDFRQIILEGMIREALVRQGTVTFRQCTELSFDKKGEVIADLGADVETNGCVLTIKDPKSSITPEDFQKLLAEYGITSGIAGVVGNHPADGQYVISHIVFASEADVKKMREAVSKSPSRGEIA